MPTATLSLFILMVSVPDGGVYKVRIGEDLTRKILRTKQQEEITIMSDLPCKNYHLLVRSCRCGSQNKAGQTSQHS